MVDPAELVEVDEPDVLDEPMLGQLWPDKYVDEPELVDELDVVVVVCA